MVMIFGEITTSAKVDYEKVVRDTVREIGFTSDDVGLSADTCKVLTCSGRVAADSIWNAGLPPLTLLAARHICSCRLSCFEIVALGDAALACI